MFDPAVAERGVALQRHGNAGEPGRHVGGRERRDARRRPKRAPGRLGRLGPLREGARFRERRLAVGLGARGTARVGGVIRHARGIGGQRVGDGIGRVAQALVPGERVEQIAASWRVARAERRRPDERPCRVTAGARGEERVAGRHGPLDLARAQALADFLCEGFRLGEAIGRRLPRPGERARLGV